MAVILPNQTQANLSSTNAHTAFINTANAEFIASATVLINNAINLGFYQIQPRVIDYLDVSYITQYFQALGYSIQFPLCPTGPYDPCFVAGNYQVLPPGYVQWNCQCCSSARCRLQISWGPTAENFLLLENGDLILLENGIDGILLQ